MPATVAEKLRNPSNLLPDSPGAEISVDKEWLVAQFPREPICPDIKGIVYDEFPDLVVFGSTLTTGIQTLIKRVTAPPSGKNIILEVSSSASNSAIKLASATKAAARQLAGDVKEQLVSAKAEILSQASQLQQAVMAIDAEQIILNSDIYQMPAALVEGVFMGFKDVASCFYGEPGSAEEKSKKKPKEIKDSIATGTGVNSAAVLAEKQTEITTSRAELQNYDDYMLTKVIEESERKYLEDIEREAYTDPYYVATPFDEAVRQRAIQKKALEQLPFPVTPAELESKSSLLDPNGVRSIPSGQVVHGEGVDYIIYSAEKVNVVDYKTGELVKVITLEELDKIDIPLTKNPIPRMQSMQEHIYVNDFGEPVDLDRVFNGVTLPP